jgi:tRNA pseudouridine13 synthase
VDREHPARVRRPEGRTGGLGGRLRVAPEDFRVEELPLRRARGRGAWTLIEIEKRKTSTFDALLFVSKAAKVSERVIGYAGLKDARAVTTQYLTLPKVPPERLLGVATPRWRVLSATRHDVPLKIGHLQGNRFTIRIRGIDPGAMGRAREVLEHLVAHGMPNAYGGQRFGTRQDGHLVGRALIHGHLDEMMDRFLGRPSPLEFDDQVRAARAAYDRGDLEGAARLMPMRQRLEKRALAHLARGGAPQDWLEDIGRGRRRIWVAAWQSYLFNRVLDERVADGTWDQVQPGDIAWLADEGASVRARPGLASGGGRIAPTGPLPGSGLRAPEGRAAAIEAAVLAEEGVDPELWKRPYVRCRGLRRPLTVPVREASLERDGPRDALVRFVLPPGSFATVLLDLLMT